MALGDVQRTSRRQFISQTRGRAIGVDTGGGSERFQILSALGKFAQAGTAEASRKVQAEIETKKALGASRAAKDLLKVESNRQGITDEDVNATKVSYNAILGKHDTMEAGNAFATWYQQNPDADEDMVESKKTELYKPIFEKYGEDPQSLKQVSLDIQESQFSLMGIEEKIKSQYQMQRSSEALTMSIGDLLSDPRADVPVIISDEIPLRAKQLGLGEFAYKSELMKEMVKRAGSGDPRLLNVLKETDWAKNSVLIEKASNSFEQLRSREDSINIGEELGSIKIENAKLTVPWETTLRRLESLKKRYPNEISKELVASLKIARASAKATETSNTEMMQVSYKNLFDPNGLPLAMNGKYSPEDKSKFIKQLDSVFSEKTEELIQSGVPGAEANNIMMKQRLDWSRSNRIKIPLLEENLKGLVSLNPDDYPDVDNLPAYATKALSMLQQMDEATLELYLPARDDKIFAANIKSSLKNRDAYSALKRAYNVKVNPFKYDSTQKNDINSYVESSINDKMNSPWYLEILGAKDVPEYQQAQLRSRAYEEAAINAYNGMLDPETNAKQTVSTVMQDYSPTFNGTLINIPKAKLAYDSGIDVSNIDDYLEKFIVANDELIRNETGLSEGFEQEDIVYDFAKNGTFTLRYRGGEQIGGKFLYSDIKGLGDKVSEEDVKKLREEAISKRNKDIRMEEYRANDETAEEAIFYSQGY